jgi:hypothetical protein
MYTEYGFHIREEKWHSDYLLLREQIENIRDPAEQSKHCYWKKLLWAAHSVNFVQTRQFIGGGYK